MPTTPKTFATLLSAVVILSSAAAGDDKSDSKDKKPPAKTEKLEPYECGKVQRLHTLAGVFLASQPHPEDFKIAKDGGMKTVVNLRKKEELEWDEQAHVKKLSMEYKHIPFQSPAELTANVFDEVRKLLKDESQRPLLLHCSSANRVGAVWLAHRVLDGGLPYDEALAEAKQVGLKLPAYEEKAKDYIQRNKK